ncbi:DEAD/DEAH box helicase [Acidaminobacter sp.]|uniref:DEAD/DEAH box helicase n=1 Tax=Acidaminobacter sp. TaxID=1872102 RepID=UPI002569AB53|nr:DEAD/DEAH box helicase [Acidaminobacter sp.]MDK9710979.1 DEAD/DEAH box helicase [Acidaminobacter sp.]
MARFKNSEASELDAYFNPVSFVVEVGEGEPSAEVLEWANAFERDKYEALYHLGYLSREKWFSTGLDYLHQVAELLIRKISQQADLEVDRELIEVELSSEEAAQLRDRLPFVNGMEFVNEAWLIGLWERLLQVFKREIQAYEGPVSRYFAEHNSSINVAGRVFFHLVESKDDRFPFAFMATYSTKPEKSKRAVHTPLKHALEEFEGDEKKLLALISAVIKAADRSAFISGLMESGELFSPLRLTVDEAYTFLKETTLYEEAGIMCRVPDWWRKKSRSLQMSVTVGEKAPSKVGMDAILDFMPVMKLGDDTVTEAEVRAFLEMAEGLVQYKGKWVELDKKKLEAVLQAFERIEGQSGRGGLTLGDAMRMELTLEKLLDVPEAEVEVSISNGQWLRALKDSLVLPVSTESAKEIPTFKASLRPYQESGYQWLNRMSQYGFGACLADDMGLGKTVQMIAFLEHYRLNGRYQTLKETGCQTLNETGCQTLKETGCQTLLVLPASLIGNWQKEIEKFAPEMPYQILHKSDLKSKSKLEIEEGKFLYITTYGMAVKMGALRERHWDLLILDEAQAIKNPGTKQTKAIKAIPASMRIAMTGTPIENRLSDLWSLFDFLNQGLLGTAKEFAEFGKKLNEETMGYTKLRRMIQPFILRRLKTDKSIIADLPDKLEMNAYAGLSKKQVLLYKQLVEDVKTKLETAEGIERKGLVLASLMKLKQICNHPDHYLGHEDFKPEHSGKFEHLRELCETIHEKRERVLVFTQFREMTEPLSEFLKEIFGKEGLVLHGGTPVKRRSEMVEQFNGEHYVPYMVLSLKAGGVGLNLTAANHVIHFDRWWNPAVENQATDRAFRIGQTKNVMVHKMVTKGTIEEKIDAIIEEKHKLSGELLQGTSGEQWITEYSNEALMAMLSLESEIS